MTQDDAEEAIAALGRATIALSKSPPDVKTATAETADAFQIMTTKAVADPFADQKLRPGLNRSPEAVASYAETQAAHERKFT